MAAGAARWPAGARMQSSQWTADFREATNLAKQSRRPWSARNFKGAIMQVLHFNVGGFVIHKIPHGLVEL
jgi:hypothetical protein